MMKFFELVSQHKWYVAHGYAVTNRRIYSGRGGQRQLQMSRLIMGEPKGLQVDHRNMDTLDNTRRNLRICQQKENMRNRIFFKTKIKGAYKRGNTWWAGITVNGRAIYIGTYKTRDEAHQAYAKYAHKLHGEFARVA